MNTTRALSNTLDLTDVPGALRAVASANLFDAVWNRDECAVIQALASGADVDTRNDLGQTPLHVAVAHYQAVIVSLLLEAGADPHALDADGDPPKAYYDAPEAAQDFVASLVVGEVLREAGVNLSDRQASAWAGVT